MLKKKKKHFSKSEDNIIISLEMKISTPTREKREPKERKKKKRIKQFRSSMHINYPLLLIAIIPSSPLFFFLVSRRTIFDVIRRDKTRAFFPPFFLFSRERIKRGGWRRRRIEMIFLSGYAPRFRYAGLAKFDVPLRISAARKTFERKMLVGLT